MSDEPLFPRPPVDLDARLQAMARALERVTRRQTGLEQNVVDLADAMALALQKAGGEDGAESVVSSWLLPQDKEGHPTPVEMVADLLTWLPRVYLRFPKADLPTCWLWHPDVVEELWWLCQTHAAAYGRDGSWQRVGDWHDRLRPGVVKRLRDGYGSCELSKHATGDRTPRLAPLAQSGARIAHAWHADQMAAHPFPEQDELDEATITAEAHYRQSTT